MNRRFRTKKWALIGVYWVAQGAVLYLGWPLLPDGPGPEWVRDIADFGYAWRAVAGIVALMALQAAFVWPVRKPFPPGAQGRPVMVSLAVAGLAIAVLAAGLLLVVDSIVSVAGKSGSLPPWWPTSSATAIGVTFTALWMVATPLVMAFSSRGRRETLLGRLAAMIFTGTIVEVAAIIPLDVMMRRRDNCYCWGGTLFALIGCGTLGVFILGPAVLIPVLSRRRKRWYGGWCEVCGYDMSATMSAERCPECGTGWRPG